MDSRKVGVDQCNELTCWGLHFGVFGGAGKHRSFSRLLGKRLVAPLPKSKSGLWGFAEEPDEKYGEFIIGVNENGDEISYTSNSVTLANNFASNPGAPHYLTAVYFRKQVLDKYYRESSKYFIADSHLYCGGLWSLQIDNHHDDKVCVWLGDLGRDLPYMEQLYWRSFNIPPDGNISDTYYKRQVLGLFADSGRVEHLFRQRYNELMDTCDELLGWQLLLSLQTGDEHHLQSIRIPSTNEQRDFDELILSLTKILIDSLNDKKLNKFIPSEQRASLKGSISLLEAALNHLGIQNFDGHIEFLRKLQKLRSSSVAHRKGSNYRKIADDFGVEDQDLLTVFAGILQQALIVLDYFIEIVTSGRLQG